jgi:hypothetical protein
MKAPKSGRCGALTASGTPCLGVARGGSGFCSFHDPSAKGEVDAGRVAGGRARATPRATVPACEGDLVIGGVGDVCVLLATTINDVRTGRLDPKLANCVGYLSGILVRAFEVGELEERLAMLERSVRPRLTRDGHEENAGLDVGIGPVEGCVTGWSAQRERA